VVDKNRNNENIGQQAGKMAGDKLKSGGRVVEIQGVSGSPTVEERSKGFREQLSDYEGLNIAYTLNGDWQRDKAEDEMNLLLARQLNDFDLVFAQNDAMALGAIRALESVGRKDVPVIGIDGVNSENGGIPLVKDEKMAGTLTSPTGGKEAIQYALDILKKDKVIPKKIILRSHRITKETVEDYLRGFRDGKLPVRKPIGEKIVLGFAQVGTESSWRLANTKSVLSSAEAAGITLRYENAEQSQEKQIDIIRQFIAEQVDVIAFSPKVETGWEKVLNEAKLAGIPVIFMDRQARVEDNLFTSYIGSDFIEEGRRAARWLKQEVGTINRTVRILELQGTEKSAPALGRKAGFDQVIAGLPQFEMLDSLHGDFTEAKGKQLMAEALHKQGKKIDVVYAHNDDMALGAIEAIEEYGLKPGKDIILISVDATERAFKAMVAGKLNLAVECNPLLGPQLMKAVTDLMEGKELPTQIITSESVFPRETAKQFMSERKY
jgi:ABC-type sugar transport system substrate-binding protein